MNRINSKQMEPSRRAGWLLGPVVVSAWPDESDDESNNEALAQAQELAMAAEVDRTSGPLDVAISDDVANFAAGIGAGLVVLSGSLVDTVEGPRRLRAAVATGRPVLVARPGHAGPVMAVADAPRAGLGAMAVAADEARRLDRPLLVVHATEGTVGATSDDLGPISAMSLKACFRTLRLRWGVVVQARSIQGPCVSAVSSLARELAARLIVLGAYDGSGIDNATRTRRMLDIATVAPCSVLLLPPPREENQWLAEPPRPSASRLRPQFAPTLSIAAPGGIQ
jgi:hypothetical protein